jgi:serine/threonine protein kinase
MPELRLQQCRLDGRYDILECLGRGSYAEIYKAHDKAAAEGAPETVVIKALNLLLQDEPDPELERTLVANFQNEAVALDRVRHPNVINRLGHGTALDLDGTTFHYIVLEYLPGGDMAALSRNKPLAIDRVLFYLEQVCSGLAHAHKCGVIHRDIKPQNLLLSGDKQTVKIADFGVARFEASEGAITRVGTNIYSAPEHNPLVQTSQLDVVARLAGRQYLTPAADIYSLAKTTYTLLAGEAPRRFAQYAITELPQSLSDRYWSEPVARVLEHATQNRAEDRFQTVAEFWDELAEAGLPQTKELPGTVAAASSRVSAELNIEPDEMTQAPPRPQFKVTQPLSHWESASEGFLFEQRPKIVVPVRPGLLAQPAAAGLENRRRGDQRVAAVADQPSTTSVVRPLDDKGRLPEKPRQSPSKARRVLVAGVLVLGFSGMLLATHRYVTSHWNPLVDIPSMANTFVVGSEGVTTTDLNLRPNPSTDNDPIGVAENGSRVRVLTVNNNWYEVQVLQHGRPKVDPFTADRGWVNKKYLKLD